MHGNGFQRGVMRGLISCRRSLHPLPASLVFNKDMNKVILFTSVTTSEFLLARLAIVRSLLLSALMEN